MIGLSRPVHKCIHRFARGHGEVAMTCRIWNWWSWSDSRFGRMPKPNQLNWRLTRKYYENNRCERTKHNSNVSECLLDLVKMSNSIWSAHLSFFCCFLLSVGKFREEEQRMHSSLSYSCSVAKTETLFHTFISASPKGLMISETICVRRSTND